MKYSGPPMTLGNAAAARVRLIVWCTDCRHQVEPDPAEMAERHDAETTVLDWRDPTIASKIATGGFSAVFFLQCTEAIGVINLQL
jgi:Domain of unknown function (DUF6471)